jgi:hypothetical protein
MPGTVLLFDLFGVIAHHQSPEGRNRLLETVSLSCTATAAFWDTYWRLRPRYDQALIHGSEYWTQVARALDVVFDDRLALLSKHPRGTRQPLRESPQPARDVPGPRVLLPHRPRQAGPGRFPLEPSSPVLPPDAAGYFGGKRQFGWFASSAHAVIRRRRDSGRLTRPWPHRPG